jgi:hypothetical protein
MFGDISGSFRLVTQGAFTPSELANTDGPQLRMDELNNFSTLRRCKGVWKHNASGTAPA